MSRDIRGKITLAVLLWIGLFAMGGCASSKQARFYTLSPMSAPGDLPKRVPAEQRMAVAIGPVAIPDYLNRPQIVSRSGPRELKLAEFERWAGSLEEDISRVVAENLSVLLAPDNVTVLRWGGGRIPLPGRIPGPVRGIALRWHHRGIGFPCGEMVCLPGRVEGSAFRGRDEHQGTGGANGLRSPGGGDEPRARNDQPGNRRRDPQEMITDVVRIPVIGPPSFRRAEQDGSVPRATGTFSPRFPAGSLRPQRVREGRPSSPRKSR